MIASSANVSHSRIRRAIPRYLVMAALPAGMLLNLIPCVALAQEQDQEQSRGAGIEEIIVTAQRREQNLQDVPISISAFTADSIEKNMFGDISDYMTKTPNASFISNGARSRRQISIRGVTNFLGGEAGNTTTGFYVDDFSEIGRAHV